MNNIPNTISNQLLKYNAGSALQKMPQVIPYIVTANNTFSATGAAVTITNAIDSGYNFWITGISVYQTVSANTDTLLTSIQYSSSTNMLQSNLPFPMITQFTGYLWPFNLFVPANNNLVTQVTNGTNTAANTVYVTYTGIRIPVGLNMSDILK